MPSKPFDIEQHPPPDYEKKQWGNALSPRRDVLLEHEKVGFEYEKTVHDRGYEQWHPLVKGRPVTEEVTQIYRKKIPNEGEFLMYNALYRGQDWVGNEKTFDHLQGRYEKPVFRLEKNPQTQEVKAREIEGYKTVYDIPFTIDKLCELLDQAVEQVSLVVYGAGSKRYGILSIEDYKNGTIEDLVICADKGKSLETVLTEKNQFTYERREQKEQKERKKEKEIPSPNQA